MELTIAGETYTVRPTDDQLSAVSIELAAFDGEVGNGTFPVADPLSDVDPDTGRQFRVDEGATVLSDGFLLDQDRIRETDPQGRVYDFGLADANALLDGFRIFRKSPSQTDVARVLAFAAADHPGWDTTWVLVANTVTMPAKTYDSDGGWTSELIPDLVEFTGKTLFVHDLADGTGRCLHYHNLTSGHACGLSISDVAGVADHSTIWEPWSPQRNRTSVDLRNSIKGRDQSGRTSIQSDATSIAAHDADGLQHESIADFETTGQPDLNVKTAAMLASSKRDRDTWTCDIGPLDETALALIRVGDIITVTAAVMGLTASDQRIAHMTLTPAMGEGGTAVPDKWMAALELGAPIRRRARVANKRTVQRVTHEPVLDPDVPFPICDNVITDGWTGYADEFQTDPVVSFFGDIQITITPNDSARLSLGTSWGGFGRSVAAVELEVPEGGKGTLRGRFYMAESVEADIDPNVGQATPSLAVVLMAEPYAPSDPDPVYIGFFDVAGSQDAAWDYARVLVGDSVGSASTSIDGGDAFGRSYDFALEMDDAVGTVRAKVWPSTETEPTAWMSNGGIALTQRTIGGIRFQGGKFRDEGSFTPAEFALAEYVFTLDDLMWCTDPGTPVVVAYHWTVYGPVAPQDTPDGATSTFTIPGYPGGGYVDGTLVIAVDGIDQVTAQTDPVAGTGTISWEPEVDNLVTMRWLVP